VRVLRAAKPVDNGGEVDLAHAVAGQSWLVDV